MSASDVSQKADDKTADDPARADRGTEKQQKGGNEPAQRQAEDDWQDSAQESGS